MLVVEHANITLFEDFSIIELDPADLYARFSSSTIMLLQNLLPRNDVESIRFTDAGINMEVISDFAKAFPPISFIPSTITEELHPATSLSFNVSTIALQFLRESYFLFLLSTSILFNEVHPTNILVGIKLTFSGICIRLNEVQQ